ncbi:dipeptidase [Blastomonas sp.]|uniref:dipeptidase n=1 Tax=Blastomonas sp. TaxID=1909299 RepID=UPI002635DBB9|nr:dipeptidase [Blastomonas sp.]MDM7954776.1 dipeptidase [Blastomonas sp.]
MIRKILIGLVLLLAAGLVFVVTVLPGRFEAQTNVVTDEPLPQIRADAAALHKTLQIADLHGDTLLWKRDLLDTAERGHIDLPRLEAGNVALQIFSSVSKTPRGQNYDSNSADTDNITLLAMAQLQPVRTWFSVHERSMWHGQRLEAAAKASDGRLMLVRRSADVDTLLAARAAGKPVTGALFSVEGLQNLEGKAENLDRLYSVGMRMAGLVHFFDNDLAGSMHGEAKGGLTPFGRKMIRAMEAKGIIVDIAHSSHPAVADILAMARRPVVSSHGGVQAVCRVNRNLSDTEIRGVAATGGIIGIGYWDGALCSTDPVQIARSIKHVRDLVGIEHAALGSDFDGAVTTRFDASQIVQVTQALLDTGFTEAEIRAVMGGNALRIIKQGIEPLPGKRL